MALKYRLKVYFRTYVDFSHLQKPVIEPILTASDHEIVEGLVVKIANLFGLVKPKVDAKLHQLTSGLSPKVHELISQQIKKIDLKTLASSNASLSDVKQLKAVLKNEKMAQFANQMIQSMLLKHPILCEFDIPNNTLQIKFSPDMLKMACWQAKKKESNNFARENIKK
ncbi:hypothetical protein RFI_11170 [Reticulomyxa filosa]|uniref:Uncharacterized protein n=1 Tax=Reticulomyxa filosa TaxID=46433 RepID=X6NJ09_RETFI|nr:hypothetical protein RFI_11170 [Reticulomyxa filosa]|eukprot:ETO25966.1 hypothetical protein RFI_11170 [Reticulomyxa filosa]